MTSRRRARTARAESKTSINATDYHSVSPLGMTELVTSTNVNIVPASTTTHVTEPVHDLWRLCGYGTLFYCCTRRFYGRKKGPSAVTYGVIGVAK